MHVDRVYGKGFAAGFLFGTVGVFVLALLSLMHPLFETVAGPFLLPGRMLAAAIAGTSASSWTVAGLYLFTGLLYGCAGVIVQYAVRAARANA